MKVVKLAAFAAMCCLSSIAQAATFVVTYNNGQGLSGQDGGGRIGDGNVGIFTGKETGRLDGRSIFASITIETADDTEFTATSIRGGAKYGTSDIVKSAFVEIDGVRSYLEGNYSFDAYYSNTPTNRAVYFTVYDSAGKDTSAKRLSIGGGGPLGLQFLPNNFDQPFMFTPFANGGTSVDFRLLNYNAAGTTVEQYAFGNAYSGTIAFLPLPEPSTWMMMIGGFGAIGGSLRRRRAATTTFA